MTLVHCNDVVMVPRIVNFVVLSDIFTLKKAMSTTKKQLYILIYDIQCNNGCIQKLERSCFLDVDTIFLPKILPESDCLFSQISNSQLNH